MNFDGDYLLTLYTKHDHLTKRIQENELKAPFNNSKIDIRIQCSEIQNCLIMQRTQRVPHMLLALALHIGSIGFACVYLYHLLILLWKKT